VQEIAQYYSGGGDAFVTVKGSKGSVILRFRLLGVQTTGTLGARKGRAKGNYHGEKKGKTGTERSLMRKKIYEGVEVENT